MIQIRKSVFETNSSSTHSICISKSPVEIPKGKTVIFTPGEYGWENRTVTDTASYLYTGILSIDNSGKYLTELSAMLDEMGVQYEFKGALKDEYGFVQCYVDHADELVVFIQAVLSDKDMLARYLFGDSFINTGNDNQDKEPNGCDIASETYWDYDNDVEVPNPYHDPEHFDYFFKGN